MEIPSRTVQVRGLAETIPWALLLPSRPRANREQSFPGGLGAGTASAPLPARRSSAPPLFGHTLGAGAGSTPPRHRARPRPLPAAQQLRGHGHGQGHGQGQSPRGSSLPPREQERGAAGPGRCEPRAGALLRRGRASGAERCGGRSAPLGALSTCGRDRQPPPPPPASLYLKGWRCWSGRA